MSPLETDPFEWLRRAQADLRAAELLLADPDLPRWPAGFHLQQAAEKALKAVLVARGRAAPRSHDLEQLAEAAATLDPGLSGWGDRLLALNDFGVAQRYPGIDEPTVDMESAVGHVSKLLADVQRLIGAKTG